MLKEKYAQTILAGNEFDVKIQEKQEKIDDIIYNTYELDDVEQATVRYALEYVLPKHSNKNSMMDNPYITDAYDAYVEYIENYFNNFLYDNGYELRHTQIHAANLYTLIVFSVVLADTASNESGLDVLKSVVDILGLSCIENIGNELIIKNRLSGFYRDGFFVIKEKYVRNWTLMSAVKDADHFARLILREEEVYE